MTQLRFEKYPLPSANMGEPNTLPDIHRNAYIRAPIEVAKTVPEEDAKNIGKGMIPTLLPYTIQDGYDRAQIPRDMDAAILENEEIRAVFLPSLGGRLWSLYDKKRNRELLYKNDVFRPANLALRNAWFSGGVEWNVGIKGHNPLTCASLFAQKGENAEGEPILRMYEFERIRGVVYTIEAALHADALIMNITIENTDDADVYMYWWSNIAVPETKQTRVIVPTEDSFFCTYTEGRYFLDKGKLRDIDTCDVSYAANSPYSRDYFYDIPKESDKWIASLERDGKGLLHFSDPILQGRKLFVWGQHNGGRHWNEWLTHEAGPYIEIQAGLLKTQLEHFIMPKNSRIGWRECYTAAELSPEVAHGEITEVRKALGKIVSEKMALLDPSLFCLAHKDAPVYYGSGWGALEERLRGKPISEIAEFPADSIGKEQADWLALLEDKPFPCPASSLPIVSFAVGKRWLSLMEKKNETSWYYYNHLGVMRYADGDFESAKEAFLRSIEAEDTAWARRNLAQLSKNVFGDANTAADHILRAAELCNTYTPLCLECAEILIHAERYETLAKLYESFPKSIRENGRMRMLLGTCYTKLGNLARAEEFVNGSLVVPDIREGEYALSNIWIELHAKRLAAERKIPCDTIRAEEVLQLYPLPYAWDYRMH
jgi:hypothetical protein